MGFGGPDLLTITIISSRIICKAPCEQDQLSVTLSLCSCLCSSLRAQVMLWPWADDYLPLSPLLMCLSLLFHLFISVLLTVVFSR